MFVRFNQNAGLRATVLAHEGPGRMTMPNPNRYRNTLWCGLAAWIGAATILAWLSYGHAARRIIAISYLQLDSAQRPAPIAHSAPDTTAPTAHTAPSNDQQQLNSLSLNSLSLDLY